MTQITLDQQETVATPPPSRARSRFGWPLGRELTILTVGFIAYRMVRLLVKDELEEAFDNSHRVVDWERAIGIFTEVDLQSTVLGNDAIIWVLNRYYFFGHFVGAALLLAWLYVANFEYYGRVRRVLLTTSVAGLVIHVTFPLAPPRWFPEFGFVDTLQSYGPKIYDSEAIANTANQIAAMPSLHVAWALIGAWAIMHSTRTRWRWVGYAHPVIMTLAVVMTANHWWLDAIGAVLIVYIAILADRPFQRWLERREHRRLRPDPVTVGNT